MSEAQVPAAVGVHIRTARFLWEQVCATPWRIALNFLLGAVLVFGAPPLGFLRQLFNPGYKGTVDDTFVNDLWSYLGTFENINLVVVLIALLIYAVFASTIVFLVRGILLQWYQSFAQLDEVRSGFSFFSRLPLRFVEHFFLWFSVALTWIALSACYEAIKPGQVFGFEQLWDHYEGSWEMVTTGDRLSWQIGLLALIAIPSALSDIYLNRRVLKRISSILDNRVT